MNPSFQNSDRASYELARLLQALPPNLGDAASNGQHLGEVEAAERHAQNVSATLVRGLQSMGRVIWSAALNEDEKVDADDFASVGLLVTELALQLQFLTEFRQSAAELRGLNAKVRP